MEAPTLEAHIDRMLGVSTLLLIVLGLFQFLLNQPIRI